MADYRDADPVYGTNRQSCGALTDDCAAAASDWYYHCRLYGVDGWGIRQADTTCAEAEERQQEKWLNFCRAPPFGQSLSR